MKTLGVIPARYASTRFPGKPLVDIRGKSMIQRVYEQAKKTTSIKRVIVATDDKRIFDHVRTFGGEVMMTSTEHRSGTDRCAEIAAQMTDFEIVINIQGDEPFIQPQQIDLTVSPLLKNKKAQIATLAKKITDLKMLRDPNIVKVVCNLNRQALYFSRNPIPYVRNESPENWLETGQFYKHIGLYAFKSSVLQEVAQLEPSSLEKLESLEQLRWLENGYQIDISFTSQETIGIDRPEDLKQIL